MDKVTAEKSEQTHSIITDEINSKDLLENFYKNTFLYIDPDLKTF